MPDCRVCNAPIQWATQTGDAGQVPLDIHEQRDYGPGRYRIVRDGNLPLVSPVSEDSPARTFVDHRAICQQARGI